MLKQPLLAVLGFVASQICFPAAAEPASPEATLRTILAYDRKGGEVIIFHRKTITPTMARLLSASLARDWLKANATGENVFDASVFSGRPSDGISSYSGFRTVTETDSTTLIEVTLDTASETGRYSHRHRYTLVKDGIAWRLDDIDYAPEAAKPNLLHASLKNWIVKEGEDLAAASAKMLGVYDQQKPALMSVIITRGRGDSLKAKIDVGTDGCAGGIDIVGKALNPLSVAFTKRNSAGICEISASFSQDYSSVTLSEGGCFAYHGFSCSFEGKAARPIGPGHH